MNDDKCKCGHRREEHNRREDAAVATATSQTHEGKCRQCGCDGFIRDVDRSWLVLARAAELVRRTGTPIDVRRWNQSAGRGWMIRFDTEPDGGDDIEAPSAQDEARQWCELMSVRWAERSIDALVETPPPSTPCHLCGAAIDKWCVPTHAGERDAGGWCHPGRGLKVDVDEVVRWARRVKRGEQQEIWPGVSAGDAMAVERVASIAEVRKAVREVTDTICALAALTAKQWKTAPDNRVRDEERNRITFRWLALHRGQYDSTIGAEVDYPGYVRQPVAADDFGHAVFPQYNDRNVDINVTHYALWSSQTGGTMLMSGTINPPVLLSNGTTANIRPQSSADRDPIIRRGVVSITASQQLNVGDVVAVDPDGRVRRANRYEQAIGTVTGLPVNDSSVVAVSMFASPRINMPNGITPLERRRFNAPANIQMGDLVVMSDAESVRVARNGERPIGRVQMRIDDYVVDVEMFSGPPDLASSIRDGITPRLSTFTNITEE